MFQDKEVHVNIKIMRIVTYQIGVDVLGFPLYAEHKIYEGVSAPFRDVRISRKWMKVFLNIIKQH